ncbi:MAG: ABC-type nitrate/sulfonate/bicarbonate transport system periplasmic component-like protein [Rhodospirillales bacterium]|nr:ABC-type nitrate/sulfonate/bicarbonate transport system periplasmic component-like protein [Rhodospirillales bacterium]
MQKNLTRVALVASAVTSIVLAVPTGAAAEDAKITFGMPGVPPAFVSVLQYTARDAGFFKKYGLDVTLREFDSGAAAARAVQSGDIDLSLSPTPVIINMISNAGVNMVTIYGMENNDFVLATTDPAIKTCADVKGQGVGVDSISGARSVALHEMIAPCGLKGSDVQEIPLGTSVGAAVVAGQLKVSVLHLDDVPVVEEQMKQKLSFITSSKEVNPVNHYMVLVALRDTVAKKRDAMVRLVAADIDATRFIQDPANRDKVSVMAAPSGRSPSVAKAAIEKYLAMEFWPVGSAGLTQKNLDAVVDIQKKTGGIKPGATAVTYDKLVDTSIWTDAMKMVDAKNGK